MANRTVKDAHTVKGTNPQYLVEKIIRSRIYDSKYWKENCFALTAELLVDKAMELKFIGGVFGGNIKPTPFLCLILKMLQIQPEKDIIIEFIKNEDFKYVRALGAYYLRLTGTSLDCYKYLEPLLNDYRKVRVQRRDGNFELSHMDEFIDSLLREERVSDIQLPRIQKRGILEEGNDLEPRVSVLEDDLLEEASSDSEPEPEPEPEKDERRRDRDVRRRDRSRDREPKRERSRERDRGDRHRERDTKRPRSRERRRRSRSRDKKRKERSRSREHKRDRDDKRRVKDEKSSGGGGGGGGGKDELSVSETNKLRAQLGLPPLK
ncbi:pre-mRNA-splicing factor 38A [Eurytemora carolleeae]|uniref:pre-mRNA-splicing factor 38A n=1 Tax=Eurytemora carolleeae TaxID=1294199 RepID=UPI000C78FA30|nr:pre-mRNA-splicing factor 38A [Eurytemora carolleeae]|eukprot:XP_023320629.1 pre-mRNA-splicing factor 38A-like [Eurytemora affinis]